MVYSLRVLMTKLRLYLARNRMIVHLPLVTYGIKNPIADWRAVNIQFQRNSTRFDVQVQQKLIGSVEVLLPGEYNILNALAALIAADQQGVSFKIASAALATFHGAGRRFDIRGEANGIIVVDDYAHHPTAIKATLKATRQRYPNHTIWAVWQPHTYSRTQQLADALSSCL